MVFPFFRISMKVVIIVAVLVLILLYFAPNRRNMILQVVSNLIFLGPEKAIVHAIASAREIYEDITSSVKYQHRLEAIVNQLLKSKDCEYDYGYFSQNLYQILVKAPNRRVLFIFGPKGSFRYSTVKYFLCDRKEYEIFIDFDSAPPEGSELIKFFKNIIGDQSDINKSKEAAFLDVLTHLEDAVKLQKLNDPQFHPYIVFRGIDYLAKIDSTSLHKLLEWSITPSTHYLAKIIFISSANILLEDSVGTERLMHRRFLLASVGYANDSQVNQFFGEQLLKYNKTMTSGDKEKILQITGGSIHDILLFFNYFSTQPFDNALNEMLKIARFRVSTLLLGLQGPTCNVSSHVVKSVVHTLGCSSGYILYEKMLELISLNDLKCLINENFLVIRSNIEESNEPIGIYVAPTSPLYGSIFRETISKDTESFCKPATCQLENT